MSDNHTLREQRELKRRLAIMRQRHERKTANQTPLANRHELIRQASQQRLTRARMLVSRERRHWHLPDMRPLATAASLMMTLCLVLAWNYRHHCTSDICPDPDRHRPVLVAEAEAAAARNYAREVLSACRQRGFAALNGRWADGLPAHLREYSAKALAPFLANPGSPVDIVAVAQRRNSVFVRVAVGEDVRFSLHLRETAPGRYAMVTVE